MSSTVENIFKAALQQAVFACAASLDALKASRTQQPEITGDLPAPADVRSDFLSILTLLYARSTSLTLILKAGSDSLGAAREPLTEIARDVARLAHCAGLFSVLGATIRSEAIWSAEEVIESIQTYLVGFTRAKAAGTSEDSKILMLRVGTIHSIIDRVKASLSTDNRTAVGKRWQSDASHLDDAMQEIKDMVEEAERSDLEGGDEADGFDDGWGEVLGGPATKLEPHEVEVAKKAMLTFRMVALLHKRILSRLVLPSTGNASIDIDLETLLALSSSLAAGFDDVAESLWSPQDPQHIISCTKTLRERVHALREPLVTSGLLPPKPGTQAAEGKINSQVSSKDVDWFQMCFDQIDKAVHNTTNT
ncbi:hypothetical protein BDV93DRAFT_519863 [Ceratobasidium sp. AG-I]|nr:hypothetical protein BDV93DRAFT_519863 [Ceratobasidium sp. AG-I]